MTAQPTILLVGAGPMAIEYANVLKALDFPLICVGRSPMSAKNFTDNTGLAAFSGGIDTWLLENPNASTKIASVIVTVGEKWIGSVAKTLMQKGFRHLLLEKPGGFDKKDIDEVYQMSMDTQSQVYVGYNRRFYASVAAAQKIIAEDGGVQSFHFEFTEWSHVISTIEKEEGVKEEWFLSNSTHVIDLAFFLGGKPKEISCYKAGNLSWHPAGSIFTGAGRTTNALFSYQANWQAPGRWALEVLTAKHRLIFRPLEKLDIQKIGTVQLENVSIDDHLDKTFKPGLYNQVAAFLSDGFSIPTIAEQKENLDWFLKIRGDHS